MCDDHQDIPNGARAIGALATAEPTIRLYVWMLRRWLDGVCGQQAVWNQFASVSGPQDGHSVMGLFEAHMSAVTRHARRKIYRHGSDCTCLGADEAALAEIVGRAEAGASTEAYQAAAQIVHGAGLFETVETATHLAKTLRPIAGAVLAAIDADDDQLVLEPPRLKTEYMTRKLH